MKTDFNKKIHSINEDIKAVKEMKANKEMIVEVNKVIAINLSTCQNDLLS